jgi:hypothetical protein
MFVRFRSSPRRLQLSLVETRRVAGKVRHEHVASLGAIATPLTVAGRVEYWQALHQRLANRLDSETQAKILGAVHARVPMPTVDEIHVLNLEQAKQHEAACRIRQVQTEGIVEANKQLAEGASKRAREGEPLLVAASEEVDAAAARRERIEQGENVSLPGKPPTLKELGITPAHASPSEGYPDERYRSCVPARRSAARLSLRRRSTASRAAARQRDGCLRRPVHCSRADDR